MGAATDEAVRPQQAAGHGHRQIPLAEMDPVGLHRQGQIDAVVDQEQGAMVGAEAAQAQGLGEALPILQAGLGLGPVLHQP